MVLEHAVLDVVPGEERPFEEAFAEARKNHKFGGRLSVAQSRAL